MRGQLQVTEEEGVADEDEEGLEVEEIGSDA